MFPWFLAGSIQLVLLRARVGLRENIRIGDLLLIFGHTPKQIKTQSRSFPKCRHLKVSVRIYPYYNPFLP